MKVNVKSLSRVQLFATPWTVAHQAPPSMGFSRQEYWSGLPFPSPGDLPDPGIKPMSPALEADALTSEPPRKPNSDKWIYFFSLTNIYRILIICPALFKAKMINMCFLSLSGLKATVKNKHGLRYNVSITWHMTIKITIWKEIYQDKGQDGGSR